jgi:hypothetical protein
LFLLLALAPAPVVPAAEPEEGKVRVVVVSILATSKDETIDDSLKDVAREVKKKSPELTGFRMGPTTRLTVAMGDKVKFAAVDENEVTVEVKAPTLASLTYTCVPGKYFPIVTGYETKNGERLIIAVMVELPKAK